MEYYNLAIWPTKYFLLDLFIFNVCFACVYICAPFVCLVPISIKRGHWVWSWSCIWWWASMWELGTELRFSRRAANVLIHSAISPAPLSHKRFIFWGGVREGGLKWGSHCLLSRSGTQFRLASNLQVSCSHLCRVGITGEGQHALFYVTIYWNLIASCGDCLPRFSENS